MVDITNTGDVHGCVAKALHMNNEHHGATASDSAACALQARPEHVVQHATLVGMVHGSQATLNRLGHLMDNIHHVDPVTRERIKAWVERATNDNAPTDQHGISA